MEGALWGMLAVVCLVAFLLRRRRLRRASAPRLSQHERDRTFELKVDPYLDGVVSHHES